jgi:hypothetical protein
MLRHSMLTKEHDRVKNKGICSGAALLLLVATAASQDIQLHTFSFETGFSVSSVSNTQIRATVSEPVVGITKGSSFAISSGFLVDFKVIDLGTFPRVYTLMQNFPNPFNSTTTIRFDLPSATNVSLKVYDLLGREIASLAQGYLEAGYHQVPWKANVASGIYFYRLRTEEFVETKKMILLK